jgi:hypothetical protein
VDVRPATRRAQRTDLQLADPADISQGHRRVQPWNLPNGWVISARPAHQALVSEADFIAAQQIRAARGPAPRDGIPATPDERRYLLTGLLKCGTCGRRMEPAWSNRKATYQCRHGHTSAAAPSPGRPKNAYLREYRALERLSALYLLLTRSELPAGASAAHSPRRRCPRRPSPQDAIRFFRENEIALVYDQAAGTRRRQNSRTQVMARTGMS